LLLSSIPSLPHVRVSSSASTIKPPY
jgi:hypothetical protein